MTSVTRVLLVLMLLGWFIAVAPHHSAKAEEAQFSLAVGQRVTVGQYTLLFRGVTERLLPLYDLYIGSVWVAQLPSPAPPPSYTHGNVRVVTLGVAPDGTAVTGTITIK